MARSSEFKLKILLMYLHEITTYKPQFTAACYRLLEWKLPRWKWGSDDFSAYQMIFYIQRAERDGGIFSLRHQEDWLDT